MIRLKPQPARSSRGAAEPPLPALAWELSNKGGRTGWLWDAVAGGRPAERRREIDIMAWRYVKAGERGGGVARCLLVLVGLG